MHPRRVVPAMLVLVCGAPLHAEPPQKISFDTRRGTLERRADDISSAGVAPRRIERVAPAYPDGAGGRTAAVTLQVTLDPGGRVAEVRPLQVDVPGAARDDRIARPTAQLFAASALEAVKWWRYEAAGARPLTFMMSLVVRPPPASTDADGAAAEIHVEQPTVRTIRASDPIFPLQARIQRIQGVVITDVTIDPGGRVLDARVLRAIPWLDRAALDAVVRWTFDRSAVDARAGGANVVSRVMLNFVLP